MIKIKGYLAAISNALEGYSRIFITVLFGVFLFFLSTVSLFFTTYYGKDYIEKPLYRNDNFLFLLCFFVILVLFLYFFDRQFDFSRLNANIFRKILVFYVFTLAVLWIFIARSYPVADQHTVSKIAGQFTENDFSAFKKGGYLYIYPFQLGIVALLEFIYTITGKDSYYLFQIINALFIALGFYVLVKICDLMFNSARVSNILTAMLFFCFPPIMFSTYVYGNILSLSLSLSAVYLLILYFEKGKIRLFVFSSLLITLSIIIKNNALIVLIAMVLLLFLKFLKKRKALFLSFFAILIICYLICELPLTLYYESKANISINEGAPKSLWIAMGLQDGYMAPGWYNGFSYGPYVDSGFEYERTNEEAVKSIRESIDKFKRKPRYFANFMYLKFVSQWNDPSYQSFWISTYQDQHNGKLSKIGDSLFNGRLNRISLFSMNLYHFVVVFSALLFILLRRKSLSIYSSSLSLIIIGGFVFHMIWEAKGQYILSYFLMLLPYAAAGLDEAIAKTDKLVLKIKSEHLTLFNFK